jgi:hypothetical protein
VRVYDGGSSDTLLFPKIYARPMGLATETEAMSHKLKNALEEVRELAQKLGNTQKS